MKIKVSSSKMDSFYDWCKRSYKLSIIEGIPSGIPRPLASFGKLLHKDTERFYKTYNLDLDDYVGGINDFYNKRIKYTKIEPIKVLADYKVCLSNFLNFQIRRLDNYVKLFGKDYVKIEKHFFPILCERYGTIKITDIIDFGFIVDSLFYNEKGNILIDFKSDKDCSKSGFKKHHKQLYRYSEAIHRINHSCKTLGVFFFRESLLFTIPTNPNYSLQEEVIQFVRDLQLSKFPKPKKSDAWKCCSPNGDWECEYFTSEICSGVKKSVVKKPVVKK